MYRITLIGSVMIGVLLMALGTRTATAQTPPAERLNCAILQVHEFFVLEILPAETRQYSCTDAALASEFSPAISFTARHIPVEEGFSGFCDIGPLLLSAPPYSEVTCVWGTDFSWEDLAAAPQLWFCASSGASILPFYQSEIWCVTKDVVPFLNQ